MKMKVALFTQKEVVRFFGESVTSATRAILDSLAEIHFIEVLSNLAQAN